MAQLLAENPRMSTYHYSRSGSDFESAIPQKPLDRYDLITFLGAAQKLRIQLLPITWQPALDRIGQGATAEIRESVATINFSFAFKRPAVRSSFDFEDFERRLLPCLIDEISILGLPRIRKHPNIIDLEGICWEIISGKGMRISREIPVDFTMGDQGIVPVLVFQKSQYGDLYHFMMEDGGKELGFSDKIDICIDVASAIAEMHSQGIIHGDIKPQNVLVFEKNTSGYTAKVADFGYSTRWAAPNDFIQMPRSQPWAAPEWHHRGFTPAQATLMDTYSFGMLVLWLTSHIDQIHSDHYFKLGSGAASKAAELIPQVVEFTSRNQKLDLNPFFNVTLTHDTANRCSDFRHLQKLLSPERYFHCPEFQGSTKVTRIVSDVQIIKTTSSSGLASTVRGSCVEDAALTFSLETANFQVIPSMWDLYQADYRVRIYIAGFFLRKLTAWEEGQVSNSVVQNTLLQCAICYEVGFGIARNPKRSQELLKRCRDDDRVNFLRELETAKRNEYDWTIFRFDERSNYQKMNLAPTGDNTPRQNLYHAYIEHEDLQVVEREYRKEITDTEIGLGPGHRFVLELKTELIEILLQCGRHKEAEKVQAQVKKILAKASGHEQSRAVAAKGNLALLTSLMMGRERPNMSLFCLQASSVASEDFGHRATVDALYALASIAADQALPKEAEVPFLGMLEISSKVLGQEHPGTLDHTSKLLWTLGERGNDEKALDILRRVRETCKTVLEHRGPVGYLRPSYLVWTLGLQQRWTKAEALQKEMVHLNLKVLGRDNANTLSSMGQLAVIFLEQGRLQKSKVLYLQAVELSEKILGKEHPKTLEFMGHLATVYQQQQYRLCSLEKIVGKRQPSEKVERLHGQIVDLSAKLLGAEHPLTLIRRAWWAWILYHQKRLEEAERLERQIMETRVRILGEKHPDTLDSMIELAYTIRKQGRWKEAGALMSTGTKTKPFLSRISRQIQLFLRLFN